MNYSYHVTAIIQNKLYHLAIYKGKLCYSHSSIVSIPKLFINLYIASSIPKYWKIKERLFAASTHNNASDCMPFPAS